MRLIIDANNKTGATEFEVGYRVYSESALVAFTVISPNPATLPVTVTTGITNARYEIYVKKKCANGTWSTIAYGMSSSCPSPLSFAAVLNGSNFDITYLLGAGQDKFDIELTDPNGGIQTYRRSDGNSGTISIPAPNALTGEWRIRLRGVCNTPASDDLASTWVSNWMPYINIVRETSSACPIISGAAISAVTDTTAHVELTGTPGPAAAFILRIVPVGGDPVYVFSTPGTWNLTGLTPSTTYDVYITRQCSEGVTSNSVYVGQIVTTA